MKKLFLLLVLLWVGLMQAQTTENDDKEEWNWQLTPYFWFTGLSGDIDFQSQNIPVSADFGDLMDNFSIGFLMHAEASKGRWFVMGDIVYLKLTKDGEIEQVNIPAELELKQLIAEIGGGYNIFNSQDWLFIDVFGGLRYFDISNEINAGGVTAFDRTTNVNDPFVGVRFKTITEKWINSARIDAGGLGIGSDISWKANIYVGYRFSELFSVLLGIQGYGIDYKKDDLRLKLNYAGVATGLNFTF
ncbi:hypothetical protein [Aureitalea marina]|uniref:Outer membrane protein beta-barrel domain-containing protein n=1 Tax=Aureitalea marina TaxID=930804 RepID=A0A2S7KMZ0_9FLAO|nr:hypothetical protein [Aureitalea marina]PQB03968.1 hypothetical protein BST85_02895 [Aureitalea marina]